MEFGLWLSLLVKIGHIGTHVGASARLLANTRCVFVMRANVCALHVCAFGYSPPRARAYRFPTTAVGLRPPQTVPHCDRPAGTAASPGAPMGGAPNPNVEIPLERS